MYLCYEPANQHLPTKFYEDFHLIFYVFCFPSKKVHWKLVREAPNSSETAKESLSVQQLGHIQSKVGFLRIWPSIASGKGPQNPIADFFEQMKGVVLQTFGMGNAPSDGITTKRE